MPERPICLIVAPSVFLLDERVFMSLGILKVAAVLESRGFRVEMADLSGIQNFEEVIKEHAKNSSAVYFGITATTPQMPAAAKIAKAIRSVRSDAKIILGGPHVTLVNAAYRKEKARSCSGRASRAFKILETDFDILVAGDGEEAIFAAIGGNAPKLIDADNPQSPLFLDSRRLTVMPYPARHLIDVESYRYFIDGERALSLIAQLGCPFGCGFCGGRASPFLRQVRRRSTESVVNEMIFLYRTYGIKGFMLYDDELNVNTKMIELMKAIRAAQDQLGVEWRLRGFIKSQLFTEKQAKAMYTAGFRWILVGFESGSPKILENINKQSTREENTRCLEIAHKCGLKVKSLMSLGHPGESEKTAANTRQWLLETRPDDFDVTIITTYPGSPYYDDAIADGKKQGLWVYTCPKSGDKLYGLEVDYTKIAEYYKGNPDGGYESYVFTDYLKAEEIVRLRDSIERDVRAELGISFNPANPAMRYEHSMGQTGLPPHIFRVSK